MLGARVGLPDVERLLALPRALLRDLGERLSAVGPDASMLARLSRVGAALDDPWRAPMRIWRARRLPEPAAAIVRLFMLHDVLREDEVRAALGDTAPLREAGLLVPTEDGVASGYHMALAGGMYFLGDRPGPAAEAVMPICGGTLDLVRAALPGGPVAAVLDLGCGAGAAALLLSRVASHVVATDVSARALAFARVNAILAGAPNVEFRAGDLYDAVAGERFDRLVAHPPCVARLPGTPTVAFAHGGDRGDELSLRILSGAAAHLAAEGRAIVAADFPVVEGDALDARLKAAAARGEEPAEVLVLQSPPKDLDEYCAQYAGAVHPELGADFARAAIAQRDHLESLGQRGVAFAVVAVESARAAEGWTSLVAVRHSGDAPVTAEAIDRMFAARRLAFGDEAAFGRARLGIPAGARSVEQPMPAGAAPALVLHPPAGRPEWPAVLDAGAAALVLRVAGASSVDQAARALATEAGDPLDAWRPKVEQCARDALLRGALEVVR